MDDGERALYGHLAERPDGALSGLTRHLADSGLTRHLTDSGLMIAAADSSRRQRRMSIGPREPSIAGSRTDGTSIIAITDDGLYRPPADEGPIWVFSGTARRGSLMRHLADNGPTLAPKVVNCWPSKCT